MKEPTGRSRSATMPYLASLDCELNACIFHCHGDPSPTRSAPSQEMPANTMLQGTHIIILTLGCTGTRGKRRPTHRCRTSPAHNPSQSWTSTGSASPALRTRPRCPPGSRSHLFVLQRGHQGTYSMVPKGDDRGGVVKLIANT